MFTSRTCLLLITIQVICVIAAQEVVKRVPQGFVGMRGKKYADLAEIEQFYKRRPQFFVGVKGKKSSSENDDSDELYYKRGPIGFVGMRGKKEFLLPGMYNPINSEYGRKLQGSLIGEINYSANEDLRTSNNDRLTVLNEILSEYLRAVDSPNSSSNLMDSKTEVQTNDNRYNEVDKRGANMHQFYGVRGKKSIQDKRSYDLTFRGKFIGVRGKKDVKNSGAPAQPIQFLLDQSGGPWLKRKAQMGFFGMRGKKWANEPNFQLETPN